LNTTHITNNNGKISISDQLSEARKYFQLCPSKKYRNVVVDQGSILSFPLHTISSQIPSGVYYPSQSRFENFVLSRVSISQSSNVEIDEDMFDLLEALGEEPSRFDDLDIDYVRQLQKEQQNRYLSENYFPTHQYHSTLNDIHQGIINFLNNKEFYQRNNLGFKRSILAWGSHGAGKSRYMEWLCKEFIDNLDAIIIRVGSSRDIQLLNDYGLLTLNRVVEDRLIVLVIEEVASIVNSRDGHISLLNVLDSSLLRDNLLVLSTTNTPHRIPENVLRNQRVDVLAEIKAEDYNDQFPVDFYQFVFGEAMPKKYKSSEWVTQKLNPADLKELFLYAKINSVSIDASYEIIKQRNRTVESNFQQSMSLGF